MLTPLFFLSIFPFLVFFFLLLFRKTTLLRVSFITLIIILILTIFYWKIIPVFILISLVKGFLIAFDIFIIIFGAIFFLEILTSIKIIDNISYYLESISKDYRVQVILLAWFLENFIEGTAGFGTPSTVVAPLLVLIGLNPITAVIISLLGNSASVAFGAAGTPIRIGFAGLDTSQIPFNTALINCVGFLVPVFMLWFLASKQIDKKAHFYEALPFAIWAGFAFIIPSLFTVFLGQEFPSILGSVIGIILILISTRFKLFVPKNIRTLHQLEKPKNLLPPVKALFPYTFLIILLVAGKLFLGSSGIKIPSFNHIFSLFNPGFAFILAGFTVVIFWKEEFKHIQDSLKLSFKRTLEPFMVIIIMSGMVQLMINSNHNMSNIPSSLDFLASNLKTSLLPLIAPIIGAFGSFITGSATISNIMFGNILNLASIDSGYVPAKILALELVGAAAGNMIALADILVSETIVGLKHQERTVIKNVILPCSIYVLLAGLLGFLICR